MDMEKRLTRKRAIRLKCLDCSGEQKAEVRKCQVKDCALFPYRLSIEATARKYDSGITQ